MLFSTSPSTSTPSDSRQKETWPAEWPGAWSTLKPATSSPSFKHPVDRVPGAAEHAVENARHRVVGLALADQVRVLGGVGVVLAHPERDASASQISLLAPW